jgi:hypothetical protein
MSALQKAVEAFTEEPEAVVVDNSPDVVIANPFTKSGRVKGTWAMHFDGIDYDFVDKQRYDLPIALYNYLKDYDNIYETL